MDEVMPHLSVARRRKVEELQAELASSKRHPEDTQSVDSTKAVKVSRIDQVQIKSIFYMLVITQNIVTKTRVLMMNIKH